MISNIKYIQEEFIKINGFYKLKAYGKQKINEEQYRNITSKEAIASFCALGGKEKAIIRRTKFGNKIVRLESISPSKKTMILRYFNFDEAKEE